MDSCRYILEELKYSFQTGKCKMGETVNGKAVWNEVENADGYQVQLYKDSVVLGSEKTVSGQTSYDFTSEIKETGSYTFKVKAIGNENYETSAGVKSAAYNFTAQSLGGRENSGRKYAEENERNEWNDGC